MISLVNSSHAPNPNVSKKTESSSFPYLSRIAKFALLFFLIETSGCEVKQKLVYNDKSYSLEYNPDLSHPVEKTDLSLPLDRECEQYKVVWSCGDLPSISLQHWACPTHNQTAAELIEDSISGKKPLHHKISTEMTRSLVREAYKKNKITFALAQAESTIEHYRRKQLQIPVHLFFRLIEPFFQKSVTVLQNGKTF